MKWWCVLCVLAPAFARAGDIVVTVKGMQPDDANKVVAYVVEAQPEPPPPTEPVKISQKNARFDPGFLVVLKGTTLDLTNDDWVDHNVYSKSPAKTFDLGTYE